MTDRLHLTHLDACRTAFPGAPAAAAKILFLGEDNPVSSAPEHALFPYPEGCAGERFCNAILGVTRHTYLATWRTNLCVGGWDRSDAIARAHDLFFTASRPWNTIVLLGAKVMDAFTRMLKPSAPKLKLKPFTTTLLDMRGRVDAVGKRQLDEDVVLVSLPHPSGRNFVWNEPRCAVQARALLREVAPDYPWGEALISDVADQALEGS